MNWKKWREYLNCTHPHGAEIALILLVGMILGSCYLYNDIAFTSSCGVKFWNCLCSGELPFFYWKGYTGAKGSALEMSVGGSYDFILYLVFAVYDFPIWVWEKLTGFSFMQFVPTRLYIKGIGWVFAGVSAYLIYKIAELCEIDREEAKWCPVLFLSSAIFFYTQVIMSGYDTISVAFTLVGIYGYLKKNDRCFVLSFAVAIGMKMFAIWIFIPLVLLREKRVWKILIYGIEGISVLVIPKIWFAVTSHRYLLRQAVESAAATGGIVDESQIGSATNGIIDHAEAVIDAAIFPEGREAEYTFLTMDTLPLVFVGMIAIWLFCYFYKKEMGSRQIVYVCAITMSVFFLTVKLHPQWAIILMPYITLIILMHPERMKENLILEGVFTLGFVFNKAINYYWTCNMNLIENMMMPQNTFNLASSGMSADQYGLSHYIERISYYTGISESNFAKLFKAAVVAGLVFFIIWNCKGEKEEKYDINYFQRRKWLLARFAVSCMVGMLPMVGLIKHLFG